MFYISDLWNLDITGHCDIDFIDIDVEGDRKLFLDPCRIKMSPSPIAARCLNTLDSYFGEFFHAYATGDLFLQRRVLAHAREQNCTHLGYGYPGKGNTTAGLSVKFSKLPELIRRVRTISTPEDLPVFLTDFAEDGLSDLLTNILHDELNDFSLAQMEYYGIQPNGETTYYSWNPTTEDWVLVTKPCYLYNSKPIMLVPKDFVRTHYLFSTDQYFKRVVMNHIRAEGGGIGADGRLIPKSEYYKHIPRETPDWLYKKALEYSEMHPELLLEYHHLLPGFYMDNDDWMTDDRFDQVVYRNQSDAYAF